MLIATMLSVTNGVGGSGWELYAKAICMDVEFWQFSNNLPDSDSVTDAMTFLTIIHSTCTGLFSGGIYDMGVLLMSFGSRKEYPPALLRASVSGI